MIIDYYNSLYGGILVEQYIQHKNLLLTRYEWSVGSEPKPKDLAARWKSVKKGHAKIVTEDEMYGSSEKKAIARKR